MNYNMSLKYSDVSLDPRISIIKSQHILFRWFVLNPKLNLVGNQIDCYNSNFAVKALVIYTRSDHGVQCTTKQRPHQCRLGDGQMSWRGGGTGPPL